MTVALLDGLAAEKRACACAFRNERSLTTLFYRLAIAQLIVHVTPSKQTVCFLLLRLTRACPTLEETHQRILAKNELTLNTHNLKWAPSNLRVDCTHNTQTSFASDG